MYLLIMVQNQTILQYIFLLMLLRHINLDLRLNLINLFNDPTLFDCIINFYHVINFMYSYFHF